MIIKITILLYSYVVWALFYGSLMLQLPTGSGIDAYNNRLSVLYYSLQFSILNELPMIQITIEDRSLLLLLLLYLFQTITLSRA
jgi:hypothetical protein